MIQKLRNQNFQLGYNSVKNQHQSQFETVDRTQHEKSIKAYLESQRGSKAEVLERQSRNNDSSIVFGIGNDSPFGKKSQSPTPAPLEMSSDGKRSLSQLGMMSNKASYVKIGTVNEVNDWATTSKHLQEQAAQYEYKAIGKHEKTNLYTNSKLTMGAIVGADRSNPLKMDQKQYATEAKSNEMLTQFETDAIRQTMKKRNVFLSGVGERVQEASSTNIAYKLEGSPNKKDLTATFENRNLLKNVNFIEQPGELSTQSVYLDYHNPSSGKVGLEDLKMNKEKTVQYKDRILKSKIHMGDDPTPTKKTVVGSDYTEYADIDKQYSDQKIKMFDNKSIVEKQHINIFSGLDGGEKPEKFTLPLYQTTKNDNSVLLRELRKVNLNMGSEEAKRNSSNQDAFAKVDVKSNLMEYQRNKNDFNANKKNQRQGNLSFGGPRSLSSISSYKVPTTAYNDQYVWKKPKYDL